MYDTELTNVMSIELSTLRRRATEAERQLEERWNEYQQVSRLPSTRLPRVVHRSVGLLPSHVVDDASNSRRSSSLGRLPVSKRLERAAQAPCQARSPPPLRSPA